MKLSDVAQPLISCIMPTYNRRAFAPQAIDYFLRQDYANKELIIIDDGSDSVADLVPDDERIRYIRLPQKTAVGAKRNLACEQACGEIIAHWDDDDWHAPHRLRYQVEELQRSGVEVCGLNRLLYYDLNSGQAWQYVYPAGLRFWLNGSALCYRRSFWVNHRFASLDVGEDARFVWSGQAEQMLALPDPSFHIGFIHGHNVAPKETGGTYWQPYPAEEISKLMGDDWRFYRPGHTAVLASQPAVYLSGIAFERNMPMLTVAKESDLSLPEYAAFNYGQSLPCMRRWELPFALFQARLANTMSVLDCTINPVNFQERLARLYPHVLYRHWNPIQNGQFALPFGLPDAAFDRVICVNTLEHLLRPQREALVAKMAGKLKPGGWLILTSDYYFDSAWTQPAFLRAGVMRADRAEIFNGWNKVTPQEWLDLCSRHDLHPITETIEEPHEDSPGLYRNQAPYAHACIGGVFYKGPKLNLPAGKKVVLALLTWNTREASVESVVAYVREARTLQRLGQSPFICVCDNGSTDGTVEGLESLESNLDGIPHKFIFNRQNLGNSIGRNQIIDYMLECDGDYLLFLDGDIEIVPFSSFAMLRHMENNGERLGCIGADSSLHTPNRERASPYLYSIDNPRIKATNLIAWTQYGLFRRQVFEDGIRFDQTGPFNGPGWGFEDNDLAFQMEMQGYVNQYFSGTIYLHRAVRSSICLLRANGMDPGELCTRRKQYLIDKWSCVQHIENGPLAYMRPIATNW